MNDELPPEALVLLDEALEALPADVVPTGWQDNGDVPGEGTAFPCLSYERCALSPEDSAGTPTWTVGLRPRGSGDSQEIPQHFLEWIDDHWRRVRAVTREERRADPYGKLIFECWRGRTLEK